MRGIMSRTKVIVLLLCVLCLSADGLAQDASPAKPESQELQLSPTATLKVYYDASDRRDFAKARSYLSQGTLKIMEEAARAMDKSLDEVMREGASQDKQQESVEFINEKINGETATVEIVNIKAESHTSVTMPLVKEDGRWKLAMDKLLEEYQKK